MPRSSVAQARDTRSAIVAHAVDSASLRGLEGLSIGSLAGDLRMSKAGVIGPFGSKEELQLSVVRRAGEIFAERVWRPAEHAPPGRRRLEAIFRHWVAYLVGEGFPGGCVLTAASSEFDGRPGRVRDAIAQAWSRWQAVLRRDVVAAIDAGELDAGTDPDQIVFELTALATGTNQARQLHGDPHAGERALAGLARVLAAAGPSR